MLIRKSSSINVKVTDFEGPLDLLLSLIREHKMDIKTVPLASVTNQYMEFLGQLEHLDLDVASEFIEVGATLVEIKSRGILPKEKIDEDADDDPEARLRAQLEEYKLLKEASEKLKDLENPNRFYKPEEPPKLQVRYVLDGLNLDSLLSAFSQIMHKIEPKAAEIKKAKIKMDRFTVEEKIAEIQATLRMARRLRFFELFDVDFSKGEIINTFLALLELLKMGEIHVVQECKFSDIVIEGRKKHAVG